MVNFETEQATPKYHSYSEHDRLLFKNAKSRIPDIKEFYTYALNHCVSFRYFCFNIKIMLMAKIHGAQMRCVKSVGHFINLLQSLSVK